MCPYVSPLVYTEATSHWNRDDEITHIEDTLRSESLAFEHLIDGCTCRGKTCSMCHRKQCCHAFARDKRRNDGLYGNCRTCQCISKHNSRARKMGTTATLTTQQWLDLKAFYDHRCLCCGKREPEVTLTIDHVVSIAEGGGNTLDNIQPLCLTCNKKKTRLVSRFSVM